MRRPPKITSQIMQPTSQADVTIPPLGLKFLDACADLSNWYFLWLCLKQVFQFTRVQLHWFQFGPEWVSSPLVVSVLRVWWTHLNTKTTAMSCGSKNTGPFLPWSGKPRTTDDSRYRNLSGVSLFFNDSLILTGNMQPLINSLSAGSYVQQVKMVMVTSSIGSLSAFPTMQCFKVIKKKRNKRNYLDLPHSRRA